MRRRQLGARPSTGPRRPAPRGHPTELTTRRRTVRRAPARRGARSAAPGPPAPPAGFRGDWHGPAVRPRNPAHSLRRCSRDRARTARRYAPATGHTHSPAMRPGDRPRTATGTAPPPRPGRRVRKPAGRPALVPCALATLAGVALPWPGRPRC
ncbi:hypothetical protein HBB16_18575 [Pseudonocardia sp. MCCB 268]|nr:hypothetical protein [Pseudonocardia cytotoxica]